MEEEMIKKSYEEIELIRYIIIKKTNLTISFQNNKSNALKQPTIQIPISNSLREYEFIFIFIRNQIMWLYYAITKKIKIIKKTEKYQIIGVLVALAMKNWFYQFNQFKI